MSGIISDLRDGKIAANEQGTSQGIQGGDVRQYPYGGFVQEVICGGLFGQHDNHSFCGFGLRGEGTASSQRGAVADSHRRMNLYGLKYTHILNLVVERIRYPSQSLLRTRWDFQVAVADHSSTAVKFVAGLIYRSSFRRRAFAWEIVACEVLASIYLPHRFACEMP